MKSLVLCVCGAVAAAFPAAVLADPCQAVADRGPPPAAAAKGKTFSGPVVYVGDGDSLCVDIGRRRDPADWVEVRLEDFYGPELSEPGGRAAKRALSRIAMGRQVSCAAGRKSYDRVVATCRLGGVSLGERMRTAGVREGGRGRPAAATPRAATVRPLPRAER